MAFGYAADHRHRKFIGDCLKAGHKSGFPMSGVLLDHWHRITSVSHLWKNDQFGASLFGPKRKIANLRQILFRIAERAGDLGNSDFHCCVTSVVMSSKVETSRCET